MSIIEKALEKMKKGESATTVDSSSNSTQPALKEGIPPRQDVQPSIPGKPLPSASQTVQPTSSVSTGQRTEILRNRGVDSDVKLDLDRLRALGMVTPDLERSAIAEEYRLIKRPLINNVLGKGATVVPNANLIMVTSSLPGEGKSFSSINLAMSIALERDKTVLLVDADVAKPSLNKTLGIKAEKGLVDYLLGEAPDLSSLLLKTNVPKLSILPSGKRHAHSTELLASENMRSLLQELASRYPDRIIIFDSPPLLATSESSVLANQMGQVVVVVEAERTPENVVKDAVAMLDKNMIIGLILNKSGQLFGSDYYGSYGYGAYGT